VTPVLGEATRKAFSIVRTGGFPQFSGTRGQIDHGMGPMTMAGVHIDETSALRVAAIWIATTVLADEIASLTMKIVSKENKKRTPVQPPALRPLWGEPNPDQTTHGIVATETLSLALHGVAFTMLGWQNGGDLGVRWPIDPSRATLERLDDTGLRLKVIGQGDLENHPGRRPQFMYVPLYTLPGRLQPVSPVRAAAELAGLAAAYDEIASRLAGRGMTPSVVLTAGEVIDPDIAKELGARIDRVHGGPSNAGGTVVLGGKDLKLERLSMSLADAEFVAQHDRIFHILLAIWRVPPTVAGMVDKPSTWGTGIAEFSRGLERFTLRPLVQRLQAGYEKYITKWEDESLQVRFSFDSLLSASPKDRAEIQRLGLMAGTTSIERVLAQNDEPPFEDDETVFSPLALALEEDRALLRLRRQADAYVALVGAGVMAADAARETGFDPARLREDPDRVPAGTTPARLEDDA